MTLNLSDSKYNRIMYGENVSLLAYNDCRQK